MTERWVGWLLRLYPRAFREEYGEGLRAAFEEQWRATVGVARPWLWVRTAEGDARRAVRIPPSEALRAD